MERKIQQICDICTVVIITRNSTRCSQCRKNSLKGPGDSAVKESSVGDMFSKTYKEESDRKDTKNTKDFYKKRKVT